jgi:proteasome lid subunit RPN8/RPN11
MIEQARSAAPIEACGILAGTVQRVQRLYRMTNTDASGEHFTMEPAEQFRTAREIRAAGLEMLALYHSHPQTPARPSAEDIRLALTPDVVHVIVSLQDPERPQMKGFDIRDGRVAEIELTVMNSDV